MGCPSASDVFLLRLRPLLLPSPDILVFPAEGCLQEVGGPSCPDLAAG